MTREQEQWLRVSEIFDCVADLDADERHVILEQKCGGDSELRSEVERLLRADEEGSRMLDAGLAQEASKLLLDTGAEEYLGLKFGPYRVERLIGQGGMGRVYLAVREQDDIAQTVALKVMGGLAPIDSGVARRRFLDERRILAKLEHPCIARFIDGGIGAEAQPWFAMEYVDGAPITHWCDQRKLGIKARLELFAKVCDAVDHAHRFLVVHRDLKPGNVLVDDRGLPKVLDFGIAKLIEHDTSPSEHSTIIMTPYYASPEQLRGGLVSTASDVFALGAMLFEILSGKRPFENALLAVESPSISRAVTGAWASAQADRCATSARSFRNSLRGDIDRVLRKALEPRAGRRYQSAAKLAEDLRAIAAGEPISVRHDRAYRVGLFARKHRVALAIAAAALVAACGFVWRLGVERTRAQTEAAMAQQVSDFLIETFDAADPRMKGPAGDRVPTARNVLDLAVAKVDSELAGSPAMLARMHGVLGRAYANLGERRQAERMLRRSAEAMLSPAISRPDLAAEAYGTLSELMSNQMRARDANWAAQRSLELRLLHDRRAASLADAYNSLGLAKMTVADYDGARAAYQEALALKREAFGRESLETAYVHHNMASLLRTMGDLKGAEANYRHALQIKTRNKTESVTVHSSRQGLAMVLAAQGHYAEAADLQRQNIRLAEKLVGRDSERVADTEMKLAMVLQQSGDYAAAFAHYSAALDITDRVLGRNSIDYAVVAGQLASLEEARGDLQASERLYRVAAEIRRKKLPPEDRTRVRGEVYLGRALMLMGRMDEAAALIDPALPRWQAFYKSGRASPEFVASQLVEADWLMRQGRLRDAENALPDVAEDAVPASLSRQALLAEIRQREGRLAQAASAWRVAVAESAMHFGADKAPTAKLRFRYAQALLALGRKAAARKEAELALASLRKQLVPESALLTELQLLKHGLDET
ncbi:tetratricopeptide repeat protein [Luteimonas sp. SX5]|uniref:Tetratricopeptide repeat protein n=1 Tax=Luteimonas galliterrae TaxID=2940486 RepID=A0ABT0MJM1_9GAMM|nr:serine/threonine-protein kinase [Luteimonas galliterrae]MCL1635087.1 tetratricopeptide repeat protein [Luteimonas galliterrae]